MVGFVIFKGIRSGSTLVLVLKIDENHLMAIRYFAICCRGGYKKYFQGLESAYSYREEYVQAQESFATAISAPAKVSQLFPRL
jgi:hypothetical protein